VECEAPRAGRDVAAFVRREAKRQDVELARGAAEALAERIGPQLLLLRQEIAKAALFAGPGRPVTVAHVAETASDAAEEPIWSLTDAIGEGRAPDALALLSHMQAGGAAPPAVLGALASHFRKLARLRMGGRVAAAPFALRKLESQARRYAPIRLRACLRALQDADERLKGRGELPPELALERLVLTLAS
jgi:DNA polymerase-3 subunit delta